MHPTFGTAFYKILNANERYVGSERNNPDFNYFFLLDWVVKDTSYYLRNEQLNSTFSVIYFIGQVPYYLNA